MTFAYGIKFKVKQIRAGMMECYGMVLEKLISLIKKLMVRAIHERTTIYGTNC